LPVLVGLAFLAFLFGLVKFILASGDEKSHSEGISFMKWSLIALFILVSFMGIISFFYSDLGFTSHPLGVPSLPTNGTL
jgi:ABC-type Fe3+-siderophore transport system permease subunit